VERDPAEHQKYVLQSLEAAHPLVEGGQSTYSSCALVMYGSKDEERRAVAVGRRWRLMLYRRLRLSALLRCFDDVDDDNTGGSIVSWVEESDSSSACLIVAVSML